MVTMRPAPLSNVARAPRSPRPQDVVTRPVTVTDAAIVEVQGSVIVSTLALAASAATLALSVESRHFSRMIWLFAAARILTVEVVYVGVAVVPPERPVHACRPFKA